MLEALGDGVCGTYACAGTALGAAVLVDDGAFVYHADALFGAFFDAKGAADAADVTDFADVFAGVGVHAANDGQVLELGFDADEGARAGFYTGATGDTFVRVDDGDAVFNFDGVVFAGAYTVAKTETAVRAGAGAAEESVGGVAVDATFVLIAYADLLVAALAAYNG